MTKYAYYTMASDEYVPGVICLSKSLKKTTKYPLNVISLDISEINVKKLQSLGCICHKVTKIGSLIAENKPWHSNVNFANNCFNKLYLWDADYSKVIYLDADCLVLKNIDHLFEMKCDFAAGPSYCIEYDSTTKERRRSFYSNNKFQAGVLLVRPDKDIFIDLMSKKDIISCPEDPSDQGFLNKYYENKWQRLNPIYNATRRVYMADRDLWKSMEKSIHVIHYTLEEPWLKSVPGCEEIEKLWWECYVS